VGHGTQNTETPETTYLELAKSTAISYDSFRGVIEIINQHIRTDGVTVRRIISLCMISAAVGGLLALNAKHLHNLYLSMAGDAPFADGDALQLPTKAKPPGYDQLTPEERVNVAVYQTANRSAVNINTLSMQTDPFFASEVPSSGQGSGTVIDQRGLILTNYHVVEGAREIQVTLFDGSNFDAKLVGLDPATDVAVLKIDAPPELLDPVEFADSNKLLVGQRVFAIGNPFGLERTLTTGIISSLNRSLRDPRKGRTIKSIIQIDAAINPGNSGGPLLDSRGRIIGMNTAIACRTGESAGVGFAIPSNTIARIVPQLVKNGHVTRPFIGIRPYQTSKGLLIAALAPDGPAQEAGLRGPQIVTRTTQLGRKYRVLDLSAADLIVAVDGKKVVTVDDFLTAIDNGKPDEEMVITVIRGGKEEKVPVELAAGE
jgi:S1-C subfamily serine protease